MLIEEPRLAFQEWLLEIRGKFRIAGRMYKAISSPVVGGSAEAAPHANFPQPTQKYFKRKVPCFPQCIVLQVPNNALGEKSN